RAAADYFRAEQHYQGRGQQGKPPVDEYLIAEMERQHIPGMTAAVVRDGKPVLAQGYGMVDLERRVPATNDTVYNLASLGKRSTAPAAMLLVEAGKLPLDAPISRYLPDVPPAWKPITVRHLLTHTSGIPDATVGATTDEVIRHAAAAPLDFSPGE